MKCSFVFFSNIISVFNIYTRNLPRWKFMGFNGPFSKHKYFNGLDSDGGVYHNSIACNYIAKILLTIVFCNSWNLNDDIVPTMKSFKVKQNFNKW